MSFEPGQFRECVIVRTLKDLGAYSKSADNLLFGTAAQESQLGRYLVQIKGPALGIFQMEPATHEDIWTNFLSYRPPLKELVLDLIGMARQPFSDELITNLRYACIMARIHYLRVAAPLPFYNDLESLGAYCNIRAPVIKAVAIAGSSTNLSIFQCRDAI